MPTHLAVPPTIRTMIAAHQATEPTNAPFHIRRLLAASCSSFSLFFGSFGFFEERYAR